MQAVAGAFLLRWLEGQSRGEQHASECMRSACTGLDLRGLVSDEASRSGGSGQASPASQSLMREGLKYLEDLHVVEHQQQHAQRQQTLQHLLQSGDSLDAMREAVAQATSGLDLHIGAPGPPGALVEQVETPQRAAEMRLAAEGEAALREALKGGRRLLTDDSERDAVVSPCKPQPPNPKP